MRKDADDSGATFDLLTEPFGGIGSAHPDAVFFGQGEDGEAFWDVLFEPGREFRGGFAVLGDDGFELGLSLPEGLRLEDLAQFGCDVGTEGYLGNVVEGILLEMELAALPEDAGKAGGSGGAQAGMIIADDEGDSMEAALLQGTQEVAPVSLGLAESGADPQDGALTGGIDADGEKDRTVDDGAIAADLLVTGIQDEIRIGDVVEWTIAPELELFIELGGGTADLGGRDLQGAGEFGENGGDTASGDALNVHLGNGESECAVRALAAFKSGGVEIDVAANLRDFDGDFAETGLQSFGFEAVGVTLASGGALVRICAKNFGALGLHGMVEKEAERFGQGVRALGRDLIYDLLKEVRVGMWMGHFGALFVCQNPTSQFGPSQSLPVR